MTFLEDKTLKARIKGSAKSWTMAFNGVGVLLLSLLTLAEQNHKLWGGYVGGYSDILLFGIMIANMLLRFKTNSDLADK